MTFQKNYHSVPSQWNLPWHLAIAVLNLPRLDLHFKFALTKGLLRYFNLKKAKKERSSYISKQKCFSFKRQNETIAYITHLHTSNNNNNNNKINKKRWKKAVTTEKQQLLRKKYCQGFKHVNFNVKNNKKIGTGRFC